MLYDLSTAQQVQSIVVVFVLFVLAFLLLALWSMLVPPRSEQTSSPWSSGELGAPGAFREPAEPSHVDRLIRAQARAIVVHDPLPEPAYVSESLAYVVPAMSYRLPLAELVASVRASLPPANAPVSPARHASGLVDTADRASTAVGRHRAPVLIAA